MVNIYYENKFFSLLLERVFPGDTSFLDQYGNLSPKEKLEDKGQKRLRAMHNGAAKLNKGYDTGKHPRKVYLAPGKKPIERHQFRSPIARHYASIRNKVRDSKRKEIGMKPLKQSQMESRSPKVS